MPREQRPIDRLKGYLQNAMEWKRCLQEKATKNEASEPNALAEEPKPRYDKPPRGDHSFGYFDGLLGVWKPAHYRFDSK